MDEVTIARALDVLSVALWVSGVAFMPTVLLPAVRRLKAPNDRLAFWDELTTRPATRARGSTSRGARSAMWIKEIKSNYRGQ
jgi:hypothetical protein